LADDDPSADVEPVELAPHGIDSRLVRRLLVAPAPEPGCSDGCGLRHSSDLEDEHTIQSLAAAVIEHRAFLHLQSPGPDAVKAFRSGSSEALPTPCRRARWRPAPCA